MLDDFALEQNIVYKTLINSLKRNKLSHAYLIETNGYPNALALALAFSKYLFCPNGYTNNKNCENCHQCEAIEKNEFIELKVIEPDGQWIKKSQLEELQEMFSKKSILGHRKVYIINNADRLNISSSNSILKFLEEPEEGIVAILIVENTSQLLQTIVSRCQVLSLKNKNNLKTLSTGEKIVNILSGGKADASLESVDEKTRKIIEFIKFYEDNHFNTLVYENKLWHENFTEKDDIYNALTVMLLFYKDVLNLKLSTKLEIFNDYMTDIKSISEKNNLSDLTRKINVIMNLREKIKFNINSNMLLDKLIIGLEGCE